MGIIKITVENTIWCKTYHEAQEQMIKQLDEKGFTICGTTYIRQISTIHGSTRAPIMSEWKYEANVIFKEK